MAGERVGLRALDLRPGYDTGDDALREFYIPALEQAYRYSRSVGWFRSSALSVAARGLSHFIAGGGTMRLVAGTDLTEEDCAAMSGEVAIPDVLAERLANALVPEDEIVRRRLEVLAWLASHDRLMLRIALPVTDLGRPIPAGAGSPYFHEKIGLLHDRQGEGVAFQGSVNETASGWTRNFESFSVHTSWAEDPAHYDFWAERFERRWSDSIPGWRVVDLPDALRQRLVDLAPTQSPRPRDPEEPPEQGDPAHIARFLLAAPGLVGGVGLAEATSGVDLHPHQHQVVERLAGGYPRSWLVADEVGLGKTISAGMALRELWLSGQVRRVLILAPASVCRQWQDELFEKLGLWASRYESNHYREAHPEDDEQLHPGDNPYAGRELLIASSHLARRADQMELVLEAGPWDLLIVDEAHHARRKGANPERYEPTRLLRLLDRIGERSLATATWLLTATPMQVHPVELRDLLVHVGLSGPLAAEENFLRWFPAVTGTETPTPWAWIDRILQRSAPPPPGAAEQVVLDRLAGDVGPVGRARIERFGTPEGNGVEGMSGAELTALREWLRQRGPVGQYVTRHGRATLRHYRELGRLKDPIADRHVTPVVLDFDADEARLYKELDQLIDRLVEASGSTRVGAFLLTVYRRRLTSSWAAISSTLRRRLENETLDLDDDLVEEAELAGISNDTVAASQAEIRLTEDDREAIQSYLLDLSRVDDTKFDQLRRDLDEARSTGQAAIVFTQFTDTLIYLRDRLRGVYPSQIATFTGDGGGVWDAEAGDWRRISRQDLVEAVQSHRITVLLANDAASEGLNLQACSFLVNYDMPWNPMRTEQRIGRIDRIGQRSPVVEIRNYFIAGTIEERVYELLSQRIDDFTELLGNLQPILGVTEEAFRAVFRAPRAERHTAEREALDAISSGIDDVRESGVDLSIEDPLPIRIDGPPSVTLEALGGRLRDQLGVTIGHPDRPSTFRPDEVSRDADGWRSLATYGHPDLMPRLASASSRFPMDDRSVVFEPSVDDGEPRWPVAVVRADRTPPVPVSAVDELNEVGEPVSADEAETLARSRVAEVARSRLEHRRAVIASREGRRLEGFRTRFLALVHRALSAEIVRHRETDRSHVEPVTVWLDLVSDTVSGWAYADTFRSELDLGLTDVAPGSLLETAMSAAEAGRASRDATGAELISLMREWQALMTESD